MKMAKKAHQFNNLFALQKYIEANIPNTIMKNGNVERVLRGTMQQAVYDVVYSSYVPHEYQRRRQDGGLGDPRLMKITQAIVNNGKFHIIFENLAQGNDTLKGQYLTDTIEEGIEEFWQKQGEWSKPRPFVQETINRIKADPSHLINAVKKAFIQAGFQVK